MFELITGPRGLYKFIQGRYPLYLEMLPDSPLKSHICRAGGGRTHTVFLPADFKSAASANSATAPSGAIIQPFSASGHNKKQNAPRREISFPEFVLLG